MIRNKFIIVTPVYNTAPYIEKCINSILSQTYKNYEYIVVEDNSTDGTRDIVRDIHNNIGGFKVCYNDVRTESPLGNFAKGISLVPGDKHDIIITVDGDDWLLDKKVLEFLNWVYQNKNTWLTYGQFISASGKMRNYCKAIQDTQKYRRSNLWVTSHLRTIKRGLWEKINDADLRDGNGKYYVYYPDIAYMFPAIEMAGKSHIQFLNKVLYVYNDTNQLCSVNDWKKKNTKAIYDIAKEIRMKPIYKEINEL